MAAPRNIKNDIIRLRNQGLTYEAIVKRLGCSKSTICYHLSKGRKLRQEEYKQKNRTRYLISKSIDNFKAASRNKKTNRPYTKPTYDKKSLTNRLVTKIQRFRGRKPIKELPNCDYGINDVTKKFGKNPKCYLTGRKIDWNDTSSWNLDHIVPRSKGGSCEIHNMGLACRDANFSKSDMTLEQYLSLCKEVLINYGYLVTHKVFGKILKKGD